MRSAAPASKVALPFLVASSRAASWAEVLQAYQRCGTHLQGVYTPSTEELRHGLAQMPGSWATALFYYSVVKPDGALERPDHQLVSQALQQFKRAGNVSAMKRLLAEDVNVHTQHGAQAALVMAAYTGMWEESLSLVAKHPRLKGTLSNRRMLVSVLCSAGQVDRGLQLLREGNGVEASPSMIRPVVKRLSYEGQHAAALRLAADSFAAGYSLNVSLFAGLLRSLRETGQAAAALETALDLNLFSTPRGEAQRQIYLFNGLVDCLYDCDPYAGEYTVAEVVQETLSRMNPRDMVFRAANRRKQFRLRTFADTQRRASRYALPLSSLYSKCISIPRWYSRQLSVLVDIAETNDATALVLDTNFLIQCVSKNLPLEHFFPSMERQLPHMAGRAGGVLVVVPFTTIQEANTLIWNQNNRLRHSVRVLLWSRVVSFVRQPSVYVLSLTTELPTMSMSILTSMAYTKANAAAGDGRPAQGPGGGQGHAPAPAAATAADRPVGEYHRNPDARVLNVCLALQHHFRGKAVAASHGSVVPEGTTLFAMLKYHVRRYLNTVKGSGSDRVVLCTMDRQLARAATEAGIDRYPQVQ